MVTKKTKKSQKPNKKPISALIHPIGCFVIGQTQSRNPNFNTLFAQRNPKNLPSNYSKRHISA